MKRKLYKWLPVLLAAVLLTGLIVLPVSAAGTCKGHHSWGPVHTEIEDTCYYGRCEASSRTCTVCGAKEYSAFRPLSGENFERTNGTHSWSTTTYDSECPSHPTTEKRCTVCQAVETTLGGHNWTEGAIVGSSTCTGGGTRVDTCSYCQEKKTVSVPTRGNHTWAVKETVEPTCTQDGYKVVICTVCQTESTVASGMKATGHRWVADDGSCGGGRHCEKCGATEAGTGHVFGSTWRYNGSKHWLQCVNCSAVSSEYAHDFVGDKCATCGYTKPANDPSKCSHTWKIDGPTSSFTHRESCTKCGATRSVNCSESTFTVPRTYCTEDLYCQCGHLAKYGQKNHNFGTWRCTDSTHTHECLNSGCHYGESVPHTYTTVRDGGFNVLSCTVCGERKSTGVPVGQTTAAHEHSYGVWTNEGGTHARVCNSHGCTEKQVETHTLGPVDCKGNAVCTRCGATVNTGKAGSTHVGGTKIVGEKPAQLGAAGYTGDTVCAGCGEVLIKGMTLEALKENHTHIYNIVRHDSQGHWHECACGDKGPVEKHTGGQGNCASGPVCAVCGEVYGAPVAYNHVGGTKLTNVRAAAVGRAGYTGDTCCVGCGAVMIKGSEIPALAESHTHTYTDKHDSVSHWKECACGDRKDVAVHTFEKGVCAVCGEKEPEKVEVHVHAYSAEYKMDSSCHWRACETCGLEADKGEHVIVNGACVDCGMTVETLKDLATEELAAQRDEAANHVEAVAVFSDIKEDAWYLEGVQAVLDSNLMKGSGGKFEPTGTTTREMMVTILARMSGVDAYVSGADWAKPGLSWAGSLGINDGFEDGKQNLTRQELVIMMYRMVQKPEIEAGLDRFSDGTSVSGEAKAAFQWAVANEIIGGAAQGGKLLLNPEKEISRAEIATIIARYTAK